MYMILKIYIFEDVWFLNNNKFFLNGVFFSKSLNYIKIYWGLQNK